jgi:hypothetical protein
MLQGNYTTVGGAPLRGISVFKIHNFQQKNAVEKETSPCKQTPLECFVSTDEKTVLLPLVLFAAAYILPLINVQQKFTRKTRSNIIDFVKLKSRNSVQVSN